MISDIARTEAERIRAENTARWAEIAFVNSNGLCAQCGKKVVYKLFRGFFCEPCGLRWPVEQYDGGGMM